MNADIEMGPMRRTHRPRLAELLAATGAFHAEEVEVALSLLDIAGEARGAAGDAPLDYEFLGAFDGGRLVGYACFGPTPATDGTFDLYWLAVDPAAQGRGIGRALVAHVRRLLLDRGARLLVVETSSRADYAHTRQFYAHGGFVEAARVRDFYAPADDRIMLTTRLTAQERGVATR
jgi:GNAT superfamily N-acetyltransferase